MRTLAAPPPHPPRRGLAVADVLAAVAASILLLALALPALGGLRGMSSIDRSIANLAELGVAHALYAAEWNGTQVTFVDDAISTYGFGTAAAFDGYADSVGEPHPALVLGWGARDQDGSLLEFAYRNDGNSSNSALHVPIAFTSPGRYFGSFRIWNVRQFNQYVSGRFYDERFYAPADDVVEPIVDPLFDDPLEFVQTDPLPALGDVPIWSSYCLSPAAMHDPSVMTNPDDGGWRDPWLTKDGFRSPSLFSARHPSLKTFMLEHHWLQNRPPEAGACNPSFVPGTYGGCEPWWFHHAAASAPVTLFYDLGVRLLPVAEAVAADEQQVKQAGFGLWSRDTPFGEDGYLSSVSYDGVMTSFHVLTTDGILGRDVIAGDGKSFAAPAPSRANAGPRAPIDLRGMVDRALPKPLRFDWGGDA